MVAGWGAYLVPFWVHRHDGPAAELRSIQGFSTAMRTLSRRKPSYVDGRYVVLPAADSRIAQPQAVHVSGAGTRRAADHSLARRRQALGSLLVMSLVSAPLAWFVGGRTVWLLAISVCATLGYAVVLRRETVRANERRRRARQLARRRELEAERAGYLDQVAAAQVARRVPAPRPVRPAPAKREDEYAEPEWQRVVGQ
ncbi:MAG: hypothetical protein QOG49_181 [Frankiaceae bacterium]|nr:hypothetical protein [Frankiaceae bacterium]